MCTMDLASALAKNIRKRRGKLTQRDFARKLGISHASIARIEGKTQNVTLTTLQQLTKSLRCNIEDLFRE